LKLKREYKREKKKRAENKTHIYTFETPIKMLAFSWFLQRWLLHVFIYDFPL
jgi:hypothetical protein